MSSNNAVTWVALEVSERAFRARLPGKAPSEHAISNYLPPAREVPVNHVERRTAIATVAEVVCRACGLPPIALAQWVHEANIFWLNYGQYEDMMNDRHPQRTMTGRLR